MAEKVREADAQSPNRWATGPTTSSYQLTLGYDETGITYQRHSRQSAQQQARRANRQTGRSIDAHTKIKTRNLELGGGWESGDVADYGIGID